MYYFTGGGYGGSTDDRRPIATAARPSASRRCRRSRCWSSSSRCCSRSSALAEGSGGAGHRRGGFGVQYAIRLRRGEARASFVMDHGRFGPPGALGGARRARSTRSRSTRSRRDLPPAAHSPRTRTSCSTAGDVIKVRTPGGGGYGDPLQARARAGRARRAPPVHRCRRSGQDLWRGAQSRRHGRHRATERLRRRSRPAYALAVNVVSIG